MLAYYIASINISPSRYMKPNSYEKFDGAVLTDTFHLYEQERDMIAIYLNNSNKEQIKKMKNKSNRWKLYIGRSTINR